MRQADPDEDDDLIQGCGPAQRLTIGFRTATFGSTITGFGFSGEEKTVTVNAKLTATGKAEISKISTHTKNGDVIEVFHSYGMTRPASGSLNIAGGMTFSFDDARGTIIKSATSTPKFTLNQRDLIRNIIAMLSIKRIPEQEIIKAVFDQTNQTISERYLYAIKQQIKRESYHWYKTMREGEYEYIHEFKERINEILFLQKKHYQIIDNNEDNQQIQQTSLAELHRLSITLSNLFDVAPTIINGTIAVPTTSETKTVPTTSEFIV